MQPPSKLLAFLRGVTYLATTALCVVATAAIVVGGLSAWRAADEAGGVPYLADPAIDHAVDRLTESGPEPRPIDPDDPLVKLRVVVVTEGMNERTARHVVERLIYLNAANPKAPIELRLATSGGWLDAAFAIVDAMRGIEAPVNVVATGGCYSAGTVVLAAATGKRIVTPSTVLSVHVNAYEPLGEFDIDEHDLRRFRDVYLRYTRVPEEWLDEEGDNQYYLDAEQALDMDLVDEIAEPKWEAPPLPDAKPTERALKAA
ncbi:MAG: ClpP family protease [Lacipirellulaceae bacterium]